MFSVKAASNYDECRTLWNSMIKGDTFSDLWEVRDCFYKEYSHPLHFIYAEDEDGIAGLLPLVWTEECARFSYFPGELWHNKTWLEQNKIPAKSMEIFKAMIDAIPGHYYIRYLSENKFNSAPVEDEIGYLFLPPDFDFSMDKYYSCFSHKNIKRILKELSVFEEKGVEYIYDREEDFEFMINLNLSRFGNDSYYYDKRFLEGFRNLKAFLKEHKMLRFTTVKIGGETAAVDMGVLYNGQYSLVAGGTNSDYPGVAKLINLHHMKRACDEKFLQIDFLCGDFSWKKNFHLFPRPLFLLSHDQIKTLITGKAEHKVMQDSYAY